jgi:hypothetical protein
MRRVLGIPRLVVTVAAIAIGVEAGYLIYLCVKHPCYFRAADAGRMALQRLHHIRSNL